MCVGQQTRVATRGLLTEVNAGITATGQHARPRTYRQPMKPRLPRKLASSARINLNRYWAVLGELASSDVITHAHNFDDEDLSNEINENIANELLEAEDPMSRFVPLCDPDNPREGCDVTLRLTPNAGVSSSSSSPDDVSVNPAAITSTANKFWKVFFDSSPSTRKASKSILNIVKKLSKHSE